MVSEGERAAVTEAVYREARLADEERYAEWLALWTDDGVYWVPATTDPGADPAEAALARLRTTGRVSVQARAELHWWAGRTTHRRRRLDGELRMSRTTVVLVNAAEPLPNLAFLI
jgi:3-phenylpropionate/cinnamic acid dioxygenase small subunit